VITGTKKVPKKLRNTPPKCWNPKTATVHRQLSWQGPICADL